jgi:hypothetical protein
MRGDSLVGGVLLIPPNLLDVNKCEDYVVDHIKSFGKDLKSCLILFSHEAISLLVKFCYWSFRAIVCTKLRGISCALEVN